MEIWRKELYHHGIKGQQWGVRHGPPYPLDGTGDITIKKGTTFKRLSIHDENAAKGHAYVNYLKGDIRHYRGFFGARLKAMNKDTSVYTISLTATHDMKAPSKDKRVQTFMKLYQNDPLIAKELGAYYKRDWHNFTPLPSAWYERKFSKLDADGLEKKGYDTFVRAIGDQRDYIRNAYFQELANQGYHFVTDDMDAGRFGREPSIIFDRVNSTEYRGQRELSKKEIMDIWNEEGTYLRKNSSTSAQHNSMNSKNK